MANQDYQKTKYELFKTYKKPTSDQVAFMQLYEKEEKTKEEEKLLQALTKKFKAYDDFLAKKKEVDAKPKAPRKPREKKAPTEGEAKAKAKA
jgi:hypothetical protein